MAIGETEGRRNGSASPERGGCVSSDTAGSAEAESASIELASRIQPLLTKLEALGLDTIELVDLQVDRARSGVRRGSERVVIGAWVGLVGLSASVMAAILLVRGLAGGLAVLVGHRVWLGELVAALLVLAGSAIALFATRSRRAHQALARQRLKHESNSDGDAPDGTRRD